MRLSVIMFWIVSLALVGCTSNKAELGTPKNPVKLYFVPSVDAKVIEDNSKTFKEFLEKKTGYSFEVSIPQSFIAVVEAFGTNRADVAAMNTFGYMLAHEKYGAQARLTVLRHGAATYQGQILVKADGPIKKLEDLKGKKLAFVDAASTSGYLLPLKVFKDRGIELGESVFASKHDNVVSMIYNGQVDAGATFYSPPNSEGIQDARRLVKTQYPDVETKVKMLELTDAIPNDPIVFRKDMPEEMKVKITQAFQAMLEDAAGREAFKKIYSVDGIKLASDADYDSVRSMLRALGKSANEMMKN